MNVSHVCTRILYVVVLYSMKKVMTDSSREGKSKTII